MLTFAAESKYLFNQVAAAICPFQDKFKPAMYRVFNCDIFKCHFGKADDSCNNIVKIMGNATGKGPDGLYLLCLVELFFQPDLFSNVPRGSENARYLALFILIYGSIVKDRGSPVRSYDVSRARNL